VQGFWVPKVSILDLTEREPGVILTGLEAEMVRYAVEELGGQFTVLKLFEVFKGQISKRKLTTLAQSWERYGWLTEPQHRADARRVTEALAKEVDAAAQAVKGAQDREN
jgi:hypothetical protein